MSIDTELRNEFQTFKTEVLAELHTLSKQQSSRRGADGARGERGSTGSAGRDAVLIVKSDHANNVVRVFDEHGTEKATLVPVAGKDGRDGVNAPALETIVEASTANFITWFKNWMKRL